VAPACGDGVLVDVVATVDRIADGPALAAPATGDLAIGMKRGAGAAAGATLSVFICRADDPARIRMLLTSDEPPGRSAKFPQTCAACAQGHFVTTSGGHVTEMCAGEMLFMDRFEVEDVRARLGWYHWSRSRAPNPVCLGLNWTPNLRQHGLGRTTGLTSVQDLPANGGGWHAREI